MRLYDRLRAFLQPWPHPETGDLLKPTERLSWAIMRQYRRWRWFLAFRVLFWVWVFERGWFHDPNLVYLLLLWSDLAIAFEQVMGLSMFPQMIRDSQVTRSEMSTMREEMQLVREIHDHIVATRQDPVPEVTGDGR